MLSRNPLVIMGKTDEGLTTAWILLQSPNFSRIFVAFVSRFSPKLLAFVSLAGRKRIVESTFHSSMVFRLERQLTSRRINPGHISFRLGVASRWPEATATQSGSTHFTFLCYSRQNYLARHLYRTRRESLLTNSICLFSSFSSTFSFFETWPKEVIYLLITIWEAWRNSSTTLTPKLSALFVNIFLLTEGRSWPRGQKRIFILLWSIFQ